jgi:Predicted dehydrogenases and related proteins
MSDQVLSNFTPTVKEERTYGKKLRIGIIGTGWIAEAHAESYSHMPDAEIVALADLIPGKAEAFKKHYNLNDARCYPDHKAMIAAEKLDAVSVCTYNTTHAECTIDALNAGINVLLEKPMCVTIEEAADIIKAEKKSGKLLSIGFQPRMDANMQLIKKIVQSGELGEIYYIQTGGGRRRGIPNSTFIEKKTAAIGALGDIGCYSLDMVLNAIGYPKPLTVTGVVSNFFGTNEKYQYPDKNHTAKENADRFNVDDFAAAFVRLEGGIVLDFRIAWAMHLDTPGDTLIFGKKAALRIPSTECWNGSIGGAMKLYTDVAGTQVVTEIPILDAGATDLFDRKIRSFLDAIENGTPAPVPSSQIFYNQAIIDGIMKSAEAGHEIVLDLPKI